MGVITTVLFYNYMQQFDSAAVVNESTVEVIVANQDIRKNQRITSDLFRTELLPEKGIHPNAIKSIGDLQGTYATADIKAGEQILAHRLQKEKEETLFVSRKVNDGKRAVSVGVNFVQSVSTLIEPEDEVDVIYSEEVKDGEDKYFVTETILQKKRVLSVGRKMIETEEGEAYVEYSSITLELTPQESVLLVNATHNGHVHMALHTRILPPEEVATDDSKSN